jgi:FtsH-binding integral membrane protein
METVIILLFLETVLFFVFFRKKQYTYDEVANFTRIFLIGIPLSFTAYFFNYTLVSLFLIGTTIIAVGTYWEYVGYSTRKDSGFMD